MSTKMINIKTRNKKNWQSEEKVEKKEWKKERKLINYFDINYEYMNVYIFSFSIKIDANTFQQTMRKRNIFSFQKNLR